MLAPEGDRLRLEPALGVMLGVMALLLVPFLLSNTYNLDEFELLYNAVRLTHGQVIYRDFFEFIPPLSEGLAAILFAVTGPSLLAARLLQAVALLAGSVCLYTIGRRIGLRPLAAGLPAPLFVVALYRAFPAYNHHWLSLAFTLVGVWALSRSVATGKPWLALLAGNMAGATLLTTQTDGLVLLVVLLGGTLASGQERLAQVRLAAVITIGLALPIALAGLYLVTQGALAQALELVWVWPRLHYKSPGGFNDVTLLGDLTGQLATIRSEAGTPFALARVVYLLGLFGTWGGAIAAARGALARTFEAGDAPPALRTLVAMVTLLAAGQVLTALVGRADVAHVAMYDLPALLLTVLAAQRFADARTAPHQEGIKWLPFVGLGAFGLAAALLTLDLALHRPADWLAATSPGARLADTPLVQLIRAHSGPEDTIVSLPWGGLHYFYGRPAATSFTQLLPPSLRYNTPEEYERVKQEVLTRKPKLVVLQLNGGPELISEVFPGFPLGGYRLLARAKTPMFLSYLDAYVYERP